MLVHYYVNQEPVRRNMSLEIRSTVLSPICNIRGPFSYLLKLEEVTLTLRNRVQQNALLEIMNDRIEFD